MGLLADASRVCEVSKDVMVLAGPPISSLTDDLWTRVGTDTVCMAAMRRPISRASAAAHRLARLVGLALGVTSYAGCSDCNGSGPGNVVPPPPSAASASSSASALPPLPARTVEAGLLRSPFRAFEGGGLGVPPMVAVLPSGDLVLAGSASPALDLGHGAMKGGDSYLVAMAPDGAIRWRYFPPAGDLSNLAVDGQGRVRVVTSEGLVALDAAGKEAWKHPYADVQIRSVQTAPNGTTLVVGTATDAVDVGGGSLASSTEPSIVVWTVDAEGRHQWSRRLALQHDDDAPNASLLAEDGSVVLASGSFVARLAKDGKTIWQKDGSKPFGGIGVDELALDGEDILAVGNVMGAATLAGQKLEGGPAGSAFAARFDRDGKKKWTRTYGDPLHVAPFGVHRTAKDESVVVVHFHAAADFDGKGARTPKNERGDTALLRLDREGKVTSVRTFPLAFVYTAASADGAIWVTAHTTGAFDIEGFSPPGGVPANRTVTTTGNELVVFRVK